MIQCISFLHWPFKVIILIGLKGSLRKQIMVQRIFNLRPGHVFGIRNFGREIQMRGASWNVMRSFKKALEPLWLHSIPKPWKIGAPARLEMILRGCVAGNTAKFIDQNHPFLSRAQAGILIQLFYHASLNVHKTGEKHPSQPIYPLFLESHAKDHSYLRMSMTSII